MLSAASPSQEAALCATSWRQLLADVCTFCSILIVTFQQNLLRMLPNTRKRCCFSGSWTRWCRQVGCGHSCPSCASRSYFGGHYKASPVAFRGKAIAGTDAADMPFVISNIASSDRRRRVVYAVAWLRLDWTQLGAVGCCRTQLAAEIEVYGP
ncbi:uncharacterized protein LOC119387769 isoform X1 [Rhipicephalus sanguineus]|uniref:uncharacterized protein LOC119387769 isoform X1 n=1 Tax=Rhipicephalus sanguineus TaxID=34632 RepID=UPI0020C3ACDF|nr:uncharacterized protein LOC119387769 isoform X1 [Rhipicephalus sanguineus]